MYRTKILTAAIALLLLSQLSGCLSLVRDQAQVDPIVTTRDTSWVDNEQPSADYPRCTSSEWINRASTGAGCPRLTLTDQKNEQLKLENSQMPGNTIELRNATQAELMTFADLECKYHQAGIYSNQSGLNFFSSATSLALSTASAVVGRGQGNMGNAARNLAAGSSFFGGTRGLMNSEIYFSYIAPAVISEVELIRKQVRADMLERQRCSLSAYPAARAINDALNYHESCSFVSGLSSLLKKAGVQTRDGDPAQEAHSRSIKARLENIDTELAAAKTAQITLPTTDTVQRATLKTRIELLENERMRWKDVMVFVGPANPVQYGYDPTSFKSKIETKKLSLEVSLLAVAELKAANPQDPTKTSEAVKAAEGAKKELDIANNLRSRAQVTERQVRELTIEISAYSQRLYHEQQKTSPTASLISQYTADRKSKQYALELLLKEQRDLGLPDGFADQFNDDVCIAP